MREGCVVCGRPVTDRRATCSEECHERWIDALVLEFGEFKGVVDMVTGNVHRVPTRIILEYGLRQMDLKRYPLWREK